MNPGWNIDINGEDWTREYWTREEHLRDQAEHSFNTPIPEPGYGFDESDIPEQEEEIGEQRKKSSFAAKVTKG